MFQASDRCLTASLILDSIAGFIVAVALVGEDRTPRPAMITSFQVGVFGIDLRMSFNSSDTWTLILGIVSPV